MRRRLTSLVVAALVALCWRPGRALAATPEALTKEGVALYNQRQYPDALERFIRASLLQPANPDNEAWIDRTLQQLQSEETAQQPLSEEDLDSLLEKVRAARQRRREMLDRIAHQLEAYTNAADANSGALLDACQGLEVFLELGIGDGTPSSKIRDHISSICNRIKLSLHEKRVQAQADLHKIKGYLALCHWDWDEAVKEWKLALALSPDPVIGELVVKAEKRSAGSKRAKEIAALKAQAKAAMAKQRWTEAVELWQKVVLSDTLDREAREQLRQCRKHLDQAEIERLTRSALDLEKSGRWLAAAVAWIAVVGIDPEQSSARAALGRLKPRMLKAMAQEPAAKPDARMGQELRLARWAYSEGIRELSAGNCVDATNFLRVSLYFDPTYEYAQAAWSRASAKCLNDR